MTAFQQLLHHREHNVEMTPAQEQYIKLNLSQNLTKLSSDLLTPTERFVLPTAVIVYLENIGFVYPAMSMMVIGPSPPILRQSRWSLLYDVY